MQIEEVEEVVQCNMEVAMETLEKLTVSLLCQTKTSLKELKEKCKKQKHIEGYTELVECLANKSN